LQREQFCPVWSKTRIEEVAAAAAKPDTILGWAWDQGWLDVNKAASVQITSEAENYPIESALLRDEQSRLASG